MGNRVDAQEMESESRVMYAILDSLGVTTNVTSWCRRTAQAINAFNEFKFKIFDVDIDPHVIGSFSDGSYREDFQSDMDNLNIYNHGLVFENPEQAPSGTYHKIISDEGTQPGYVKLEFCKKNTANVNPYISQSVNNTKTMFIAHRVDSFGLRLTADGKLLKTNKRLADSKYKLSIHGPAEANVSPSLCNQEENVYAYRCGDWPMIAEKWAQRCQDYDWPSAEDLMKLKQQIPCHMVPMGHPHSDQHEKEVQWRYSFTLHEQFLMSNLNGTQLKCYFLLKQIKTDLIHPKTRELTNSLSGKSLTSYHCKTSLLYAMQKGESNMWKPENLIGCLQYCLRQLIDWLNEGFIPDFFIPEQNVMDGKIEGTTLIAKIKELLESIASYPINSLKGLQLNIGGIFSCSLASNHDELKRLYDVANNEVALMILLYMTKTAVSVFDMCGYCLHYIAENSNNLEDSIKNHHDVIKRLNTFMETQDEDVRKALQQALSYLYTSLASQVAVMANKSESWIKDWMAVSSAMFFSSGSLHNIASWKLKLATVLLMSGHVESARRILDDFDNNVDTRKLCLNFGMAAPVSDLEKFGCISFLRDIGLDNIIELPCSLLLHNFLSAPVIFLPTEMELTPHALIFEMFRSIATPPDSIVLHLQYWYRWASVDVKFMSAFLKYIANHGTNMHALVDDITSVVSMDNNETPRNMLGWAAMNEGDTSMAARFFIESWAIVTRRTEKFSDVFKIDHMFLQQHNAAKLWMLVLIWRLSKNIGMAALENIHGKKTTAKMS